MMVDGTCEAFNLDDFTQFSLSDKDCCSAGMFLPDAEAGTGTGVLFLFLQLIFLCYIFLGIALGADVFMQSIEVITSKEVTKSVKNEATGENQVFHVRVWNATVANLTLMALGSSAPEILLSVIEVMANGMATGPLGPSTIVGSAAFNLMIITAVCIIALPDGETRTLKQLGVFLTTAAYSVWAYVWLMVIVIFWTPQVITVIEGILTMVFFAMLVINAYWADRYWDEMPSWSKEKPNTPKDAHLLLKRAGLGKDATPEEMARALQDEIDALPGLPTPPPSFRMFSGYVDVSPRTDGSRQMFSFPVKVMIPRAKCSIGSWNRRMTRQATPCSSGPPAGPDAAGSEGSSRSRAHSALLKTAPR
jgi:Ca2+/Na+ antiporter